MTDEQDAAVYERGFDAGKAEAWSEWTEGLNETIRTELTAARKAALEEVGSCEVLYALADGRMVTAVPTEAINNLLAEESTALTETPA